MKKAGEEKRKGKKAVFFSITLVIMIVIVLTSALTVLYSKQNAPGMSIGAKQLFITRAYQEGKVDYLNVLDAQRTLFDVKSEYIESLAAYHTAKTDIERFIGNQDEAINISESEE